MICPPESCPPSVLFSASRTGIGEVCLGSQSFARTRSLSPAGCKLDEGERIYDIAMALVTPLALAMRTSPGTLSGGSWNADYFYSRTITIYVGTQDIHRNLIAERIYGLPR